MICVLSNRAIQATTFAITNATLYVLITLPTQGNAKLLQKLKSGFKKIINWNKYQSKVSVERKNKYLDYLIHPSFQRANRRFLWFQNNDDRIAHTGSFSWKSRNNRLLCYDR